MPAARVNRDPAVRELCERASESDLEEKEVRCLWRPQAELNEFLIRTVAADGCASAEVHETPIRTVIINRAARTRKELSEKGPKDS